MKDGGDDDNCDDDNDDDNDDGHVTLNSNTGDTFVDVNGLHLFCSCDNSFCATHLRPQLTHQLRLYTDQQAMSVPWRTLPP